MATSQNKLSLKGTTQGLGRFLFFSLDFDTHKTFLAPLPPMSIAYLHLPVLPKMPGFVLPTSCFFSLPWLINQVRLLVPEQLCWPRDPHSPQLLSKRGGCFFILCATQWAALSIHDEPDIVLAVLHFIVNKAGGVFIFTEFIIWWRRQLLIYIYIKYIKNYLSIGTVCEGKERRAEENLKR